MTIHATIEGRMSEPTLRTSKAGREWCSFSVAVDDGAERQWVSISAFGDDAQVCAGLEKGCCIRVEGRLRLNTWTGKDGRERTGLQISASSVQTIAKIGRRQSDAPRKPAASSVARADYARPSETAGRPAGHDPMNGRIPF